MWDRFRGGGGGGSPTACDDTNNNETPYDPSKSWQPRSSVIAARQRQQQPRQSSVDSYHLYGKNGPPPPRPPRNFSEVAPAPLSQRSYTTPLPPPPPPPPSQPQSRPRHARGDSIGGRPASSVYSQPSPLHTNFRIEGNRPVNVNVRYRPGPDDVSPPSSPELLSPGYEPNHDISPIDEDDRLPDSSRSPSDQKMSSAYYALPSQQRTSSRQASDAPPGPNARSNLPMMRRERRQQQRDADAAANRVRSSGHDGLGDGMPISPNSRDRLGGPSPTSGGRIPRAMPSRERMQTPVRQDRSGQYVTDKPRGQKDPRWDPMTGEIASSGSGRPSQVKPVEFARGLGISTMSSKSPPQAQTPPVPASDTDPAAAAFQSSRPGWRGASGRTAIVDPVQDNMEVEPLKVPPKSARRASPSPHPIGERSGGGMGGDIAMASPPISPETQLPKIGAVGGGAWQGQSTVFSSVSAGAPAAAKSSKMSNTLNTIRKIIPSSRSNTSHNANAPGNQGYPSPPLSGSPTSAPGPAPVNAANSRVAAPVLAPFDAAQTTTSNHLPLPSPSAPSAYNGNNNNTSDSRSIRRKEIGSRQASPSAHLSPHPIHHQAHDSFSSSVYSRPSEDHAVTQQQQPPPNTIRLNAKELPTLPGRGNNGYVQPPSRFSITTYATSANTASPRDSVDADVPPLPTPPKDTFMGLPSQQPQSNPVSPLDDPQESVLTRSRPKLRGGENKWEEPENDEAPIKISLTKAWMSTAGANSEGIDAQNSPPQMRKPKNTTAPKGPRDMLVSSPASEDNGGRTGGLAGGFFSYFTSQLSPTAGPGDSTPTNNSRPASILSVDKALPLAPPQEVSTTTGTRIEQLNALLSGLGNRRININRAIEQMTKLMPQDNLLATDAVARKREAEKRKIEELERELADIQREEHELGMKLHRAYKKLDSQTEYEPTTLWVRRAAR